MKNRNFFVHESSYIDDDVEIGDGTKIWHFSHIQSGARIGKSCSLGQNVNVGNRVKIGDNVKIQNNVSIYEGVELEDFVFCGPSMVFTNIINPRSEFPQRGSEFYKKTLVKKSASLGANSTIICGIIVGEYAFIAAGAVVTGDVCDYALMAGVPARVIGWMCKCATKLNLTDKSDSSEKAVCSKCGRRYQKTGVSIQYVGKSEE